MDFGACKANESEDPRFNDSELPRNQTMLAALGMPCVLYHFGRPDADPRDDVEAFLNYANPSRPNELLCLDLETSPLSQAATNAWARGWAEHCRQLAPDYSPGIYMSSAYLTNRTGEGLRGPFGWLWYKRYPFKYQNASVWPLEPFAPMKPFKIVDGVKVTVEWADCAWGGLPDFWQFTDSFVTPQGPLDADVFNGTLEDLRILNTR